ncbi:MAG: hypothetical protein MR013_03040 [Prevotella sp.]|nr:hypothetical protein [Prevotella sp.]
MKIFHTPTISSKKVLAGQLQVHTFFLNFAKNFVPSNGDKENKKGFNLRLLQRRVGKNREVIG